MNNKKNKYLTIETEKDYYNIEICHDSEIVKIYDCDYDALLVTLDLSKSKMFSNESIIKYIIQKYELGYKAGYTAGESSKIYKIKKVLRIED